VTLLDDDTLISADPDVLCTVTAGWGWPESGCRWSRLAC